MRYKTFKHLRTAINVTITALIAVAVVPFIGLLCMEDAEPRKMLILAVTAFTGLVLATGLAKLHSFASDYMAAAEADYLQRKKDRHAGKHGQSNTY